MEGHQAVGVPVPGEGRPVDKSAGVISDLGGAVRQTDRKPVREKLRSGVWLATVPQTDTGRLGEDPKALERTLVKELGKIAP